MKLVIYYIQFLSLLFLYPHHALALTKAQESFSYYFQKKQQVDQIISDDLQNLNDFFDDELSDNNDNDPISARKKVSYRDITCSYITRYTLPDFFNNFYSKFRYSPNLYSPLSSDFISLRVLRL